jgi:hypothetical protein
MTELDFDVHFGSAIDKKVNWREVLMDDEPDDDEELENTPEDVIGMLGFDPKEFNEEFAAKGGPGSGSWNGPDDPRFAHEGAAEQPKPSKDKTFTDLPKWQQKAWQDQASQLSENDRNVVGEYQGSGIYDPLNIYLRTGKLGSSFNQETQDNLFAGGLTEESLPWLKQEVENLDKAINTSFAPSDCVVYRGIDNNVMTNAKVGDVFMDKGFMSTSFNPMVSRDFAGEKGSLLKIRMKHGTKALYADPITDLAQQEVILARNSKLKLTAVRKEGDRRVLYADLIRG